MTVFGSLTFPGAIYDATGARMYPPGPDLQQEEADACPHRSMVTDRDAAPVSRVWVLNDDATFAAIHQLIVSEAVNRVLNGYGVLILAQHPAPEADVRDGLLHALDLATVPVCEGGRA